MEFEKVMGLVFDLCRRVGSCSECPLRSGRNGHLLGCREFMMSFPKEAEPIILKWHAEHPPKTFIQKFRNLFPDSPADGYLSICPAMLGKSFTGPDWKAEDHCGNGCKSCWETRILDPDA